MKPSLIALCMLLLAGFPAAAQEREKVPVDLELVLAVDVSGSIDEGEAALQRRGYIDAIRHPEVVKAVTSGILRRIGVTYFEWAGQFWQKPVVGWRLIDSQKAADAFAAELAAKPVGLGPWTSISTAILFGMEQFEQSPFEGTRQILDISGDGPNNTGAMLPGARDLAAARRITINGLPIINDRPNFGRQPMPNLDLYYRNCVIGGPGAFIVAADGFGDFARAIRRKLVLEIAGRRPAGQDRLRGTGFAQSRPGPETGRRVPPCDEGEKRFRGMIDDEW